MYIYRCVTHYIDIASKAEEKVQVNSQSVWGGHRPEPERSIKLLLVTFYRKRYTKSIDIISYTMRCR